MKDHPLSPMTNANLVDLLGRQTRRRVGLASYCEVEAGTEKLKQCFQRLRDQGISIAIVDCLNENHLEIVCRAAADLRLISGSSAFGIAMPAIFRERGWLADQPRAGNSLPFATNRRGCLVVAGSCSAATRGQNEWWTAEGFPLMHVHPQDLLSQDFDRDPIVAEIRRQLTTGHHLLLTTTDSPAGVSQVQEWAAGQGLLIPDLGREIATALADLVLEVLQDQDVGGLIVAGGETSGALCRQLELGALRVGRNIDPGVPLCFSLGRFRLPIVLKSGNFGSQDFYGKALQAVARPSEYLL